MRLVRVLVLAAVLLALGPHPARAASAAPSTAGGFTAMFAAKNDLTWSGGDQATSVVANGRVYWIFGDTMTSNGVAPDGSYPAGTKMVSNRILLQQGDQLTDAGSVPDPATHTDANNERYWPMGAFYTNGHLYVLCQRLVADPDPVMPFRLTGVEMAKYRIGLDGKLHLVAMLATPSTGVDAGVGPAAVQWSGDAIIHNGYVYVYGYTLASGNPYVAHFTYVARVPAWKVENPAAWRFWKKTTGTWVSTLAELDQDPTAQPDALIPSQVSSVRLIGGKFVLAHKPWNGWGTTVFAEVSAGPVGPFTQKALFDSPAGTWEGRQYQTYGPMLHPEQTMASGKVLVSINWNGQTLADLMGNADLYKPRFHEVTL